MVGPAADVVDARLAALVERQERLGDVARVDDVPHLLARAEEGDRPAEQVADREVRDPAVVLSPELAGAVDAGQAEARRADAPGGCVDVDVVLRRGLRAVQRCEVALHRGLVLANLRGLADVARVRLRELSFTQLPYTCTVAQLAMGTSWRRAASSTWTVPTTFVDRSSSGSSMLIVTAGCAAVWTM